MKKITLFLVLVIVIAGGFFLIKYLAAFTPTIAPGEVRTALENKISTIDTPEEQTSEEKDLPREYSIEEVASGLNVPWSIVFTDSNRMLITERPGNIRVIKNGVLKNEPLHHFAEVVSRAGDEEGLMGLAVDPDYEKNKFIYTSLAYQNNGGIWVKVVRFTDERNTLSNEFTVIKDIPADTNHAGNRIKFGPDGKLYITTGDATDKELAQDLKSLAGKILRINSDGSIPSDNPFPDSPVWSYGHRNPQGISWHPETDKLYSSEHGPSVFDGPAGGDEVNYIIKGGNYGWPLVSHEKKKEGTIAPLVVFTPAEAPADILVYSGKTIPQWKNNLFFGALKGSGIMRLVLDENNPDKISLMEKLPEVKFGRIREVMEGADSNIYFSTSNRDGRGTVREGDDHIYRIRPK